MNDISIRVEGLGKKYRIGAVHGRTMLREAVMDRARAAGHLLTGRRAPAGEEFIWALRDVSFEIRRGEVMGIIGGNGAGKSTLLKILSRITEPTLGAVGIRGRVGSLLEVGTGFHPELTGRENTYLNGAVLGMTRREVDRKFDEIVAFAEIERFIDTPVKRYSSGMYLRLGFAVAAHLEPEILIVDEVLAVGDVGFQRKCLGRMEDVAKGGRTVLFVSHNMDAVQRLCSGCMLLEGGGVTAHGPTAPVVERYLSLNLGTAGPRDRIDLSQARRTGTGEVRFRSATYRGLDVAGDHAVPGSPLEVVLEVAADRARTVRSLALSIRTTGGTLLINADVVSIGQPLELAEGCNLVRFRVEELPLNPGRYVVGLRAGGMVATTFDLLTEAFPLEVVPAPGNGPGMTPQQNGAVHCRFSVESRAPQIGQEVPFAGRIDP
jgi:lipopolysaccharide transport system ATP-binding protein